MEKAANNLDGDRPHCPFIVSSLDTADTGSSFTNAGFLTMTCPLADRATGNKISAVLDRFKNLIGQRSIATSIVVFLSLWPVVVQARPTNDTLLDAVALVVLGIHDGQRSELPDASGFVTKVGPGLYQAGLSGIIKTWSVEQISNCLFSVTAQGGETSFTGTINLSYLHSVTFKEVGTYAQNSAYEVIYDADLGLLADEKTRLSMPASPRFFMVEKTLKQMQDSAAYLHETCP